MYPLAGTAGTNYHRLVAYKNGSVFSAALEARSLQSGCRQGWFLLEALREDPSHVCLLAAASSPWCSLVCRHIAAVYASILTLPLLSYKDTCHWI